MSASLGLGPTRRHMQNMKTSEFLHLLGHSSGSAGSWDVFRGRWHNTAISGILLWRCVLSRAGRGVLLLYFPSSFSISSTCQVGHLDLEILLSHISSNFCDVFCWTLNFENEKSFNATALFRNHLRRSFSSFYSFVILGLKKYFKFLKSLLEDWASGNKFDLLSSNLN